MLRPKGAKREKGGLGGGGRVVGGGVVGGGELSGCMQSE